jgi:hypothetical protein
MLSMLTKSQFVILRIRSLLKQVKTLGVRTSAKKMNSINYHCKGSELEYFYDDKTVCTDFQSKIRAIS